MQRKFSIVRRAAVKNVICWPTESDIPETRIPRDRHTLLMMKELDLYQLNHNSVPLQNYKSCH
jgi:hypothetical protein